MRVVPAAVPQEEPVRVVPAAVPQEEPGNMVPVNAPQGQPVIQKPEITQEQPLVADSRKVEIQNPVVPTPTWWWQKPKPCVVSDPGMTRVAMVYPPGS